MRRPDTNRHVTAHADRCAHADPLPTVLPTPSTDEIVVLAQQFYDNQSPFAGTYVFVDATAVEVQS